jgi:hypothetical protein
MILCGIYPKRLKKTQERRKIRLSLNKSFLGAAEG